MRTKNACFACLLCLFILNAATAQKLLMADSLRLEKRIHALAIYGSYTSGVMKRVAFSKGDLEARQYIIKLMDSLGLAVSIDEAGNIYGRKKGTDSTLPYISFGSHIDAVPAGGIYDGDLGVLGALECIDILNHNKVKTRHPLEVIVFTDEEEGLIGSKAIIGHLKKEDLNTLTNSGKTIGQGINDIGGNINGLDNAQRNGKEITAFLELHIEQGSFLETEHKNIGIVQGIVGMKPYDIVVEGVANHAGTTPMNMRKDALLTACRLVVAINEAALSLPGRQVATVGQISVSPGATNVIPGKATISLDLRDLSEDKMELVFNIIKHKADSIALLNGTKITFISKPYNKPVLTDKSIQALIESSANELGLSTKYMASGALHDTQDMAKLTAAGMIFVPSKNGISHSPDEYTSPADMANGANVLLKTILKIDAAGL